MSVGSTELRGHGAGVRPWRRMISASPLFPGPQGAKPSELAARLRASKQSINHLLGQLERMGYLERRDDPDDLRSRRIHLTPRSAP
jgi:DNA-binding MarR family transcriptional regulator